MQYGLIIAAYLFVIAVVMIGLDIRARRRSTGAIATGALRSVFAPVVFTLGTG